MTREITHMKAFTAALESMGKPRFSIGKIPPTPGLVDQYFNDSTGDGDEGEVDARGPWNEGGDWEFVEAPAFQDMRQTPAADGGAIDDRSTSDAADPRACCRSCSWSSCRTCCTPKASSSKALPKMAEAAAVRRAADGVREASRRDRGPCRRASKEAFELLGAEPRRKPCKGMAGLIEEGQEIMDEGRGPGGRRCRSRVDRRGAEGRALRDFRLRHRADAGRTDRASPTSPCS